VGSRPSRSKTPGRKGSISTSAWGRRERSSDRPAGDLRETEMDVLWRVRLSGDGGGGGVVVEVLEEVEWALGWGRSIRRTLAP
jgi:hypothetical protein